MMDVTLSSGVKRTTGIKILEIFDQCHRNSGNGPR